LPHASANNLIGWLHRPRSRRRSEKKAHTELASLHRGTDSSDSLRLLRGALGFNRLAHPIALYYTWGLWCSSLGYNRPCCCSDANPEPALRTSEEADEGRRERHVSNTGFFCLKPHRAPRSCRPPDGLRDRRDSRQPPTPPTLPPSPTSPGQLLRGAVFSGHRAVKRAAKFLSGACPGGLSLPTPPPSVQIYFRPTSEALMLQGKTKFGNQTPDH
jgi:hypothetical protein